MSCNSSNLKTDDITQSIVHSKLDTATWLIGKWTNDSPTGKSTEIWQKQNDSTFAGISFMMVGADTVSFETILLHQTGDKVFYTPTVKDQNSGQAVDFMMTSCSAKKLVFENQAHDFPQKILYEQITNDSMVAEISGMRKGELVAIEFPMVRE